MKIFHPQTTLHGAERDNSFIVHDVAGVELGQGWLQMSDSLVPVPDRSVRIRMHMDAHPAARDMLYGALYARARLLGIQRAGGSAHLVAECDPEDAEMRGYYTEAGFDDAGGPRVPGVSVCRHGSREHPGRGRNLAGEPRKQQQSADQGDAERAL